MYSSRFSCSIKVAFIFNMYMKELRKKTFKKCDGTSFVASPYGCANEEKKIDGVEYERVVRYVESILADEGRRIKHERRNSNYN